AFPRRRGATPAATTPASATPASATPAPAVTAPYATEPYGAALYAAAPAVTAPATRSAGFPSQVESHSEEAADPFKRTSFKLAPDEYAEIVNHRPTPEPLERIFDTTTIGRIFRFRHPERDGAGPFWRNWMWVPVALLIGLAFLIGGFFALETRPQSTAQSTLSARPAPALPIDHASRIEPQNPVVVTTTKPQEREGSIAVEPVTSRDVQSNIDAKAVPSSNGQTSIDAKTTALGKQATSPDAKTVLPDTRLSEQSTKPFVDPARVTPKVTVPRESGTAPKAQRAAKASRDATPKSVPAKKVDEDAPRTPFVKTPFIPAD
ncbi:MAG: hypothetical protein ACM3ZE_09910, partial [Myxococcales bacterium]